MKMCDTWDASLLTRIPNFIPLVAHLIICRPWRSNAELGCSPAPTATTSHARADLDLASAGVVKALDGQGGARSPGGGRYPSMPWEPKTAFDALADYHRG